MSTRAVKFNIDMTANPRAARQLETALKRLGQTGRQAGRDIDRGFKDPLATMGKLKGAIAALGAGMVMRTFVRNTIEAEQALAQLDAILMSTGNAAGFSRKQLLDMAREMSRSSIFDEQQIISAQTRLLSYSGIVGVNIPRAMQSVIDQSTRLGISVEQSAETIGRALESPSKAAAALAQQGFGAAFTEEVRGTIDALVAAGREAEAQIMILEILEESYGGAAQAARDTFGGAVSSLKNALKSLLTGDTSGDGLKGATDAVNELAETLNDPQVQQGFQTLITGALQAIGVLARFASTTAQVTRFIGEEIAARVHGPAAEDVVRVEQRIERLKQTLAGLDAVEQRGALAWFSPDFLKASEFKPSDFVKPVSQVRARLQAELDAEEAKLKVGVELNEAAAAAAARLVEEATAPITTPDPPVPTGGTGGTRNREAEQLQQAYQRVNDQLRQQLALFNRSSEGARILYEVQHGGLRDLAEPQKQELLNLALRLDNLRELAEAAAEEQAATESARAEAKAMVEATYTAEERLLQLRERAQQLRDLGLLSELEYLRVIEDVTKKLAEATGAAQNEFEQFGIQAARNLQTAFADFLFDPFEDGLRGMLNGFVDVVRKMVSEALAAQLLKALFGKLEGAGEGGGAWGSFLKGLAGAFGGGSAKGNVFQAGAMVPFANGGIVKGPITFPMANGQFGLMGEAGPEAIMPLRRGPGGRLGVDASAGGQAPEVNIRQITVLDPAELASYMFSAQNERVIVQYLDRLGFGARN